MCVCVSAADDVLPEPLLSVESNHEQEPGPTEQANHAPTLEVAVEESVTNRQNVTGENGTRLGAVHTAMADEERGAFRPLESSFVEKKKKQRSSHSLLCQANLMLMESTYICLSNTKRGILLLILYKCSQSFHCCKCERWSFYP